MSHERVQGRSPETGAAPDGVSVRARASEGGSPQPAREVLTLMFTDVVGSTPIGEALGDAAAHELMSVHNRLLREQATAHGATEIRSMGDGFLFVFGSPSAAVACAIGIQSEIASCNARRGGPQLRVRVGIHSGEVLREHGDVFGQAVALAQRIMSTATHGQIMISESVRLAALPVGARIVDRGIYHLKGFSAGHRLYEALCDAPGVVTAPALGVAQPQPPTQETAFAPYTVGALQESPFIGRARELGELEEHFEQTAAGRGRVVMLVGEAGIGKTRLAVEFLGLIRQREVTTATGRCYADLAEPYQPFLDGLRELLTAGGGRSVPEGLRADLLPLARVAPDLQRWLGAPGDDLPARAPEEERLRLLSAWSSLFLEWSRHQPLVMFLDDLQWADAHSLDLLRFLGRRLTPLLHRAPCPILILLGCRASGLDQASSLAGLLAELDRDRLLVRLQLRGLEKPEVRLLLRALRGGEPGEALTEFVTQHSLGNPYFVEEIFRHLAGRLALPLDDPTWPAAIDREWYVPHQVKAVIEQRLSGLSPGSLDALAVGALVGTRFRFEVLRAASGLDESALIAILEEGLATRVLREERTADGVRYSFEHSLVAEVLAERMSAPRQERTHLAIALALERVYGRETGERALEIARHLRLAGQSAPTDQVIRQCTLAGDVANALYAYTEAATHYEAALAALARLGQASDVELADLQCRLFPALGRMGRLEEARRLADAAITALERAGQRERAEHARAALAAVLILHAQHRDALPYLAPIAEVHGDRPDAFRGGVLAQYAMALDITGQSHQMRATADRLLGLARALRSRELHDRGLQLLRNFYANHTDDIPRALRLTERLLRGARARGELWDEATLCEQVGLFQFHLGRIGAALHELDPALDLALRTGTPAKIIDVRALRAMCFCFRGEWEHLDAEWEQAAPLLGRVPGALRFGWLLWARSRVDLWLERPLPAMPTAEQIYPGLPQFQTIMLAIAGLAASERGEAAAEQLLGTASAQHPRDGAGVNWLLAAQALASGWANLARADEASEWYEALAPYRGTLFFVGCVALELARIAALKGWWAPAAADFQRGIRLYRREGLRPLLGIALFERAAMHLARARAGDRRLAGQDLVEARSLFTTLGMRQHASRAERLMREHIG